MTLEKARREIDSIDDNIVELLNERAKKIKAVAAEKRKSNAPVFDPASESEVLGKLTSKAKDFPSKGIRSVFTEIFSFSRAMQQPLTVSFLGPKATFTHIAAIKKFVSQPDFKPEDSIAEVFDSVEKGKSSYGVVPVENSMEGSVNHTLDMFLDSNLSVVGEISLEVRHHLLSKYRLKEIKKVYSHPQAFAQCRKWLNRNLRGVELVEVSSTSKGAESAKLYLHSAAIASELAAKEFGLEIVDSSIQDSGANVTRFLVIGMGKPNRTGKDKTSILFSVRNKPGALFKALKAFHDFNINMTKIESRPAKTKAWDYVFFVDFQGFAEDEAVKKSLGELEKNCGFMKILGSYPEEA